MLAAAWALHCEQGEAPPLPATLQVYCPPPFRYVQPDRQLGGLGTARVRAIPGQAASSLRPAGTTLRHFEQDNTHSHNESLSRCGTGLRPIENNSHVAVTHHFVVSFHFVVVLHFDACYKSHITQR
jgi:hypothetical protein